MNESFSLLLKMNFENAFEDIWIPFSDKQIEKKLFLIIGIGVNTKISPKSKNIKAVSLKECGKAMIHNYYILNYIFLNMPFDVLPMNKSIYLVIITIIIVAFVIIISTLLPYLQYGKNDLNKHIKEILK